MANTPSRERRQLLYLLTCRAEPHRLRLPSRKSLTLLWASSSSLQFEKDDHIGKKHVVLSPHRQESVLCEGFLQIVLRAQTSVGTSFALRCDIFEYEEC